MIKLATLAVLAVVLVGCGPQVVGGNSDAVWLQKPVLSIGSVSAKAEAYCAQFGKTAVPFGTLTDPTSHSKFPEPAKYGNFTPIYSYRCK